MIDIDTLFETKKQKISFIVTYEGRYTRMPLEK